MDFLLVLHCMHVQQLSHGEKVPDFFSYPPKKFSAAASSFTKLAGNSARKNNPFCPNVPKWVVRTENKNF
jgi:hypothetical protein